MHIAEMQLHPIEQFLDSDGSYTQGIDLFEEFGGNEFLVKHFRNTSEEISEAFLRTQLKELLASLPPIVPTPSRSARFSASLPGEKEEYPPIIQELIREKAKYYQEQSYLHTQLLDYTVFDFGPGRELQVVNRALKTEEERYLAAIRIHQLDRLNQEIWEKLDHFQRTGELPEVPEPLDPNMEPALLVIRRNTLRTYLSKFPLSVKVTGWQNELNQIQSLLS